MRTPKQIKEILKELEKVWIQHPELRISQLLWNVFKEDPYYMEDPKFIEIFKTFYKAK